MDDQETQEPRNKTPFSEDFANPIEAVKKVALAGLGAVAVATKATDEVFETLVKKGETARDDVMREIRESRARGADTKSEAQTLARQSIDSILNKAQLASKSDIDALNAKLNLINRKLDEVHAAHAEAAPAPPPPAPPFTDSNRE